MHHVFLDGVAQGPRLLRDMGRKKLVQLGGGLRNVLESVGHVCVRKTSLLELYHLDVVATFPKKFRHFVAKEREPILEYSTDHIWTIGGGLSWQKFGLYLWPVWVGGDRSEERNVAKSAT
jgi:hypothetical protein